MRFVPLAPGGASGIAGMALYVSDPDAVRERAQAAGVPMEGGAVVICNVPLHAIGRA